MNKNNYDVIIVGSGMSGLYSAYNILKASPKASVLILEKYKRKWVGGRASNDTFYGVSVVTGAGIGRKDTNPLLIKLMNELGIHYTPFLSVMDYSKKIKHPVDVEKVVDQMKLFIRKHPELAQKTFKQAFIELFGETNYKQFVVSSGYSDYEKADVEETLYNYGMDDNKGGWTGLCIPWKQLVEALYDKIGADKFRFSCEVVGINPITDIDNETLYEVDMKHKRGDEYKMETLFAKQVIIATTITGIKQLVPTFKYSYLYDQIVGQPFLRLYGKFDKRSSEIMGEYVKHYTIVPGPLQKIIPMDSSKGVYMIAYSDNKNALFLKEHLENNEENRAFFCGLIEDALGIDKGTEKGQGILKLIAIKDYYWSVGTHYYKPLRIEDGIKSRDDFLKIVKHPRKGLTVVGEAVSRYQGWTEGALGSVKGNL